MSSKRQSLDKLCQLIEERGANRTDMIFRNAFGTACYLYIQGQERAALKLLSSLFGWLGLDGNKTYFSKIRDSLPEYAAEYASDIQANLEINKLFYAIAPTADSEDQGACGGDTARLRLLIERLDDLAGLCGKACNDYDRAAVYAAAQSLKSELLKDGNGLDSYAREKVVSACWSICAAVGYDVDNNHEAHQHVSWAYGEISTLRGLIE